MNCRMCGNKMKETDEFCTQCGCRPESFSSPFSENNQMLPSQNIENTKSYQEQQENIAGQENTKSSNNIKENFFWYYILSFFIPIAGVILYFNYKEKAPKPAKTMLIIGVVSWIINIIAFRYI